MKWDQHNDLEDRLLSLGSFYGHQRVRGFYLFDAYDEVPDDFRLHETIDTMERFCGPCARQVLVANGYDPDPEYQEIEVWRRTKKTHYPPMLHEDSQEHDGPNWCPVCGALLETSYTQCAVEGEVENFKEEGPIYPHDLPALHQLVENARWLDGSREVDDLATDCLTRLRVDAEDELAARNRATVATLGSAATAAAGLGRRIRVWMDRAIDRTVED